MTEYQRWCVLYMDKNGNYTPSLQNVVFLEIFSNDEKDDVTYRHLSLFLLGCIVALKEQMEEDDKKPSHVANELYFLAKTHVDMTEKFHALGLRLS